MFVRFQTLILSSLILMLRLAAPGLLMADGWDTMPVRLPECGPANPSSLVLRSGTDLNLLNIDTDHSVFCLQEGTYQGITLTRSGTQNRPLVLRAAPGADRARVIITGSLQMKGANWWIIDGLTFDDPDGWGLLRFLDGSGHNVVNQVIVQHGQNLIFFGGGNYNTIQNSILRESRILPGKDSNCLIFDGEARFNRVLNNEIYNCAGDGIQVLAGGHGLLVRGNEFYVTPTLYSDCQGQRTPEGPCACAENAIDIKSAADDADPGGVLTFQKNVAYGFRTTDPACGGSGGNGPALVIHRFREQARTRAARNVFIESNIVFDSQQGVRYPASDPQQITLRNNIFYGNFEPTIQIDGRPVGQEILRNTIVNRGGATPWLSWRPGGQVELTTVRDNLIIRSDAVTLPVDFDEGLLTIDHNAYFDTPATNINGDPRRDLSLAYDPAQFDDLCFIVQKHTDPQPLCLPNVIPTRSNQARAAFGVDTANIAATSIGLLSYKSGCGASEIVDPTPPCEIILPAAADAYVRDGPYANRNYGTSSLLAIRNRAATGKTRRAYVQFNIDTMTAITSATLQVYGRVASGSHTLSVYAVPNTTWTEQDITWNNAPDYLPDVLDRLSVNNTLWSWWTFDVTTLVQNRIAAGEETASFVLFTPDESSAILVNSREALHQQPRLVLTTPPGAGSSSDANSPDQTIIPHPRDRIPSGHLEH